MTRAEMWQGNPRWPWVRRAIRREQDRQAAAMTRWRESVDPPPPPPPPPLPAAGSSVEQWMSYPDYLARVPVAATVRCESTADDHPWDAEADGLTAVQDMLARADEHAQLGHQVRFTVSWAPVALGTS